MTNTKTNIFKQSIFLLSACVLLLLHACDFEYPLPEEGSLADETPPSAAFSYSVVDTNHLNYSFSNESGSATDFVWDFGDGTTSTDANPSHIYSTEGTYTVTLTSTDKLNASDQTSQEFTIYPANYCVELEVFIGDACDDGDPDTSDDTINEACICGGALPIAPEILNGDFEKGQDNWKFSSFTDGTTNPFNASSDGSNLNYDGSDNGEKTPGAKWTKDTSAGVYVSAGTRYAYQAIVVSPNTDYVLAYEYAIKNDGTQAEGGNRIVGAILDGHFDDGVDGVASFEAGPLMSHVGDMDLGKGVFTTVKETFMSNESGEVAIFIFGVTDVDAYVDNVKVYPN